MKTLYALTALTALLAAAPAMAADDVSSQTQSSYKADSNGGYDAKDTVQNTDANGTTTVHKTEKKVNVDSDGNKSASVDTKTTVDPKGLMNKKTTEIHNKASNKDGVIKASHKKNVDGKTVEQTDQTTEQ